MQARTFASDVTAAEARCSAAALSQIGAFLHLRHAPDIWLLLATVAYIAVVFVFPNPFTIGIGIWWLLNTVSHNFIHQPFFKSRRANRFFAFFLSILTLIPHRLWSDKHLAHHAGRSWRFRFSRELACQSVLLALLWSAILISNYRFVFTSVGPGFLLAMALCWLQGYFEHATGTTSHYSKLYNRVFFNDGFHIEHHEHPALHWTALPGIRQNFRSSKWPAVLRWCDWLNLNGLETVVTRFPFLQRGMTVTHEKAVRKLVEDRRPPKHVVIIGGGLFPRTALVVHAIWPAAAVTIIDSNPRHLAMCRRWLRGDEILVCKRVSSDSLPEADMVFVPLAFDQDKGAIYECSEQQCVVLHDWVWNTRADRVARSTIPSIFLFKRLNLLAR
jgi:hypothetical protein